MTFNAENLFDTAHAPGKEDWAYQPLAAKTGAEHRRACARSLGARETRRCLFMDWSEPVLRRKLERVASVVLQVENGRGPDILVLEEVENLAVLERLRAGPLAAAGYRPGILIEGGDPRGIDVGILSRLERAGDPALRDAAAPGSPPMRGFLQADFRLPDGRLLTVFAVHFPSAFHPTAARAAALGALDSLLRRLPRERMALAAGDFNVTAEEEARDRLFEPLLAGDWAAAHELGCPGCAGTHYYAPKDSWSFLDRILLRKSLSPQGGAPWALLPESVRVANALSFQKARDGTPAPFDPADGSGVSDHWPLYAELERRR